MAFRIRPALLALAPALAWALASTLAALSGFKRPYYLGVLLPLGALLFLLLAWLLYLRDDGLQSRGPRPESQADSRAPEPLPQGAPSAWTQGAPEGGLGGPPKGETQSSDPEAQDAGPAGELGLFAPLELGRRGRIIPRSPDAAHDPRGSAGRGGSAAESQLWAESSEPGSARLRKILLWAALYLVALAAFLYGSVGVGAGYYF